MSGLTSKVLRTFKASSLFQKEIDKINPDKLDTDNEEIKISYLISMFHNKYISCNIII